MKSGFVSIIGRPNVGKSTLINAIVNSHIAITSDKAGTTRNIIQGVYNDPDTQIIFVDTPGIHKPIDKLGVALNNQAYYSINDVDILLLVVDASVPYGKGDQFIIDKLSSVKKPVFLILNKIDKLSDEEKQKTEDLVNEWISQAIPVEHLEMKKEDAIKMGAEAMFIEKYGDIVSVYKIGDVSLELCGGPHVSNTSELGHFKIKKEESSSSGVRRIKAILC